MKVTCPSRKHQSADMEGGLHACMKKRLASPAADQKVLSLSGNVSSQAAARIEGSKLAARQLHT